MSSVIGKYGFAAEPYKAGWVYSPAWIDDNEVKVSDLASMMPVWTMKKEGKFFPCETEDIFCPIAMQKAKDYCKEMNGEL